MSGLFESTSSAVAPRSSGALDKIHCIFFTACLHSWMGTQFWFKSYRSRFVPRPFEVSIHRRMNEQGLCRVCAAARQILRTLTKINKLERRKIGENATHVCRSEVVDGATIRSLSPLLNAPKTQLLCREEQLRFRFFFGGDPRNQGSEWASRALQNPPFVRKENSAKTERLLWIRVCSVAISMST